MTSFVGVSFGVLSDRIAVIAAGSGFVTHAAEGMSTREVLACLLAAQTFNVLDGSNSQRNRDRQESGCVAASPVFVTYDSAVDWELAFRDLSKWDKDMLFGLWRKLEDRDKENPLYESNKGQDAVQYEGCRLQYVPGKIVRLKRLNQHRRALTIYDIAGYFEYLDIASAGAKFLAEALPTIERNELGLWQQSTFEALIARCQGEAVLTARLAHKVEDTINGAGIVCKQWYGPSAIAARCLSQWRARRQAKRLHDKNSPHELLMAIDRAYFGGRVEAIKLGTLYDVAEWDINSAYAYATAMLAQFFHPLRFTRRFNLDDPFSVWLTEYELPKDALLGVLPTRSIAGSVSYRLRGKGYFWQPEVEYLAHHFPGCYRVREGYTIEDAEPVSFAADIHRLYDYRKELRAKGNTGEKFIKLALANLYGKFAQNEGVAYFQCRAWAGWITSHVRRMLLDAVTGIEDKVICFSQDAVHVEASAQVNAELGTGLGQWKQKRYRSGLYLAPGIYELSAESKEERAKQAMRGTGKVDFEKIARELSERGASSLERVFFVGWQLARMLPVQYEMSYLQSINEALSLLPGRLKARNYVTMFNWLTESRASTINQRFSGLLSARYFPAEQNLSLRLRLKDRGWA